MQTITDIKEIQNVQAELLPRLIDQWALLTAGPADDSNTMTIAWGSLGDLWWKPVIDAYVAPSRYTFGFMQKYDNFTVSFLPDEYHDDLMTLGTLSGRDGDKIAQTRLTRKVVDGGVTFEEADTVLVCKKIYVQPLDPAVVPDWAMQKYYADMAPHVLFLGEIVSALKA